MISRTTGLYGLKFAKSSALADDFSYLISYNWSVLLQLASEHGLACYCSQVYLKQKGIKKRDFKTIKGASDHIRYAQLRTLGGLIKY